MDQNVTADEIRHHVREALRQLVTLQEQGRIVMAQDRYNTDWPDSAPAISEAIKGLEHAVDAMYWMETLPHPHSRDRSPESDHPDGVVGE